MKSYGPKEYMVEIILRYNPLVSEGETATEYELLEDCRKFGSMVYWEIE